MLLKYSTKLVAHPIFPNHLISNKWLNVIENSISLLDWKMKRQRGQLMFPFYLSILSSPDYYWFCVNKFWHLEIISSSITKAINSFWIEYSGLSIRNCNNLDCKIDSNICCMWINACLWAICKRMVKRTNRLK